MFYSGFDNCQNGFLNLGKFATALIGNCTNIQKGTINATANFLANYYTSDFILGLPYIANQNIVVYNNKLYKCKTTVAVAISTPDIDTANWDLLGTDLSTVSPLSVKNILTTEAQLTSLLADFTVATDGYYILNRTILAWASSIAYVIGNLVTNGGNTYRCKTAHTSTGSFDATKFDLLTYTTASIIKKTSVNGVSTSLTLYLAFSNTLRPNTVFNLTDGKVYFPNTATSVNSWVLAGGGFSVIADTTTTTLNLNTVTETGITNYSALTSLTNGPTGIVPIAGKLTTVANYYATNGIEQHLLLNDDKYFRSYINNIWSSWQLIATVDTTPNIDIIDALQTPPVSPSNGDSYFMLANPTGAWSTFAQGSIATYNEATSSWVNTIPANGTAYTFSNPVNLNSINAYYTIGQTYKVNSTWSSPVIAGFFLQLFIAGSQFQPYNNQSVALSLVSNVVTATCPSNHNLAVGYSVTISSSPNSAFNETVTVAAIVSPTVFRYAKTLANTTTTGTLTATTQLLPSGCTSVLIPLTISFNVVIAVAAGSYNSGSLFTCTNLRLAPCYVAGIPIGKLESMILITSTTAQWQPADNTTYEVLNITAHGFTNAVHRHKTIVKLETGNTYVLTDGADSSKVSYGKIILNVIDLNNILVGNGGKITTFADHGFVSGISYSYGNPTNGGIGNIVDGETLTTGNRATIPMLKVIDDKTIDFSPKVSFIAVNTVIVQAQIDSATKKYVLTDGQKTNDANASNNIITGSGTNTLTFNGAINTVYGKFSGIIETLLSTNIAKLASQIPVFNASNPNLLLTTNINTVGIGNYILAINKAKTNVDGIFAIPLANFTDAVNNVATSITAGKIGYQLNPVVGYRHNGSALEQYDWIPVGQVNWDSTSFSNVINYAFNGYSEGMQTNLTLGSPFTLNHNIGSKKLWLSGFIECKIAQAGYSIGDRLYFQQDGNEATSNTKNGVCWIVNADGKTITGTVGNNAVGSAGKTNGVYNFLSATNWSAGYIAQRTY
jgi:hypothetical protein